MNRRPATRAAPEARRWAASASRHSTRRFRICSHPIQCRWWAEMAKTQAWKIEVRGATSLHKALQILGETDAPFLREALETSGQLLRAEAAQRAPAGIAQTVASVGVKGKGAQLRALIRVKHPGGKSMEFGRQYYYRGYRGRQMKKIGRASCR